MTAEQIYEEMNHSLTRSSIKRYLSDILKTEKVEAKYRPRISKPKTIVSAEHSRVGLKILWFRTSRKMNPHEFSMRFQLGNRLSVGAMEGGFYDFTLLELQRIATILGTDIPTLLAPSNWKAETT